MNAKKIQGESCRPWHVTVNVLLLGFITENIARPVLLQYIRHRKAIAFGSHAGNWRSLFTEHYSWRKAVHKRLLLSAVISQAINTSSWLCIVSMHDVKQWAAGWGSFIKTVYLQTNHLENNQYRIQVNRHTNYSNSCKSMTMYTYELS